MPVPVVFVGADHAGFALKGCLLPFLKKMGVTVVDLSPTFVDGDDYPKIAQRVARHVKKTSNARGVLVCGSGVGVTMAANRLKGIRAFDAYDEQTTKLAREHENANIIGLSGWRLTQAQAEKLLSTFFTTKASPAPRHKRRIEELG